MTIGEYIRDYAKSYGHNVVGKLTRRYDLEEKETMSLNKYNALENLPERKFTGKIFTDEAGNEFTFFPKKKSVVCVTVDGGVY